MFYNFQSIHFVLLLLNLFWSISFFLMLLLSEFHFWVVHLQVYRNTTEVCTFILLSANLVELVFWFFKSRGATAVGRTHILNREVQTLDALSPFNILCFVTEPGQPAQMTSSGSGPREQASANCFPLWCLPEGVKLTPVSLPSCSQHNFINTERRPINS